MKDLFENMLVQILTTSSFIFKGVFSKVVFFKIVDTILTELSKIFEICKYARNSGAKVDDPLNWKMEYWNWLFSNFNFDSIDNCYEDNW